jgi:hypothetical protein
MQSAIVGQAGSRLCGIRSKCCNRDTLPGQSVYWHLTRGPENASYRERVFLLHSDCMAGMAKRAPEGVPAKASVVREEMAALRAAARAA